MNNFEVTLLCLLLRRKTKKASFDLVEMNLAMDHELFMYQTSNGRKLVVEAKNSNNQKRVDWRKKNLFK